MSRLAERDKNITEMGNHQPTRQYLEDTYNIALEDKPVPSPLDEPPTSPPDNPEFSEDPGLPDSAPTAQAVANAVGPRIDDWAERVREAAEDADSLSDFRDWLERRALSEIDVETAAEKLGQALVAAHLAGRDDADTERVELAQNEGGARLAFDEQIRFFRRKLNLSTESWTDIWRSQHDRAFMVAGAARVDLVNDLRDAVDAAIAVGETLESFRSRFDGIVEKHGWSYKGGRNWRTRVIYETNLRTSYAAGRYEQMKEIAARRPYWRYRHSHASESPRLDHQSWDGLVLRHDDPWWNIHYPPNGWGCKCSVESLSERDLERLGKDGPDEAPALRTRRVTVGARGRNPQTVTVPEGVDPGWDYAPGRTVAQRRRQADFRDALDAHYYEGYYDQLLEDASNYGAARAAPQLTPAELVAVRWYTLAGHKYVNQPLRETLPLEGGADQWPNRLALAGSLTLRDALAKLPARRGVTYRAVGRDFPDEVLDRFQPGEVVPARDFISSSKSEEQARRFGSKAQFTILGRAGRDIEALSAAPREREVLFDPYRRYRVVSREEGRPNRWGDPGRVMIELEEVDDG